VARADPLGIEHPAWDRDPKGILSGGNNMAIDAAWALCGLVNWFGAVVKFEAGVSCVRKPGWKTS